MCWCGFLHILPFAGGIVSLVDMSTVLNHLGQASDVSERKLQGLSVVVLLFQSTSVHKPALVIGLLSIYEVRSRHSSMQQVLGGWRAVLNEESSPGVSRTQMVVVIYLKPLHMCDTTCVGMLVG